MNKLFRIIAILVAITVLVHLDTLSAFNFIIEVFITKVLEAFKPWFNKHLTYYF
ncbi:hypothetical protein H8S90_15135 [Olivibacter sp. SDN3]|uniref:hypothetical protein n=1 Tax=Olivibacter sp. SDN3 TaxID=2764720 RepID=UPI0016510EE5|nr:hypothetical protein [Olivibacter sp. SDN3]QNL48137.1 hypothetical protein H8S90_15135 [Olivibacter sp. SDN3]